MILWWDQRISIALGMSGAAGAAGRGAGSERGAAGPWGRGWPARRGGKGKRSLPSVESPVYPVVFARAVSSDRVPSVHTARDYVGNQRRAQLVGLVNQSCVRRVFVCGSFDWGKASAITNMSNVPPRDD